MNSIEAWTPVIELAENVHYYYPETSTSHLREGEVEFLENYDPSKYGLNEESVVYTADACMFTVSEGVVRVLMIRRGNHPYKGYWCLPGGFVDVADADSEVASIRELAEETGIHADNPTFVGRFDQPNRDPRMKHIVSDCYFFIVENELEAEAADDAADADWILVTEILNGNLFVGFDHILLVKEAVKKVAQLI